MSKTDTALYGEGLLGGSLAPEKGGALAERFMVPPFSVLSARDGYWQDRKRAWLSLGIQSELGRGENITWGDSPEITERGLNYDSNLAPTEGFKDESGRQQRKPNIVPAPSLSMEPLKRSAPLATEPRPISLTMPPSAWTPPEAFPSLDCKQISIDVETYDPILKILGPGARRGGYIVGLSIGTDYGFRGYYPMRHQGGGNMDPETVLRWARAELGKYAGNVVGANLIYDLDFLAQENVLLSNAKRFHDIQLAEPLLDEHRLKYSVDALARDYLNETKTDTLLAQAAQSMGFGEDIKGNLWKLPAGYVGAYGESDVDLPLRILPLQLKKLEEEGLLDLFDLECRLIPLLLKMRRNGVRVDVDGAEQARVKLVRKRDAALHELRRLLGEPRAELNAPASFAAKLAERGLPMLRTPKNGQYSITKPWLKANEHDPAVKCLLDGRKYDKLIGTFIDGHIMQHHVKGRVHTQFHQLKSDEGGTIGRFASSSPNLQQIPQRDDEAAEIIRSLFLPEEGEQWECDDYSQIEVRFEAHYAVGPKADEFRQRYIDDPATDYHAFTAEMLGIDINDKPTRIKIKGTNFAKKYGAMAPKLAQVIGCSLDEAKAFVAKYEEAMPFTKETFNLCQRRAAEKGYIKTILGRHARFPLWEPAANARTKAAERRPAYERKRAKQEYPGEPLVRAFTYTAMNNLLQLGSADLIKKAMVDSWEAGVFKGVTPLLTVHDELDISVGDNKAAAEMRRIMETAIKLRVPILVESKRGNTWGECR